AGADVPHVTQVAALVDREHERSEALGAAPLAAGVAGDDELLPSVRLHLQPVTRSFALAVLRVRLLRHHAFETAGARRLEQRSTIVERLGEADGLVAPVEELCQAGLTEVERAVHDRITVELEQI